MEDAETLEDAIEILRKTREMIVKPSMLHRKSKTGHDERCVRLEGERREGVASMVAVFDLDGVFFGVGDGSAPLGGSRPSYQLGRGLTAIL